jgi:serralysin
MANSFTITLSGDQEVPATGSAASGSGTVIWDEATQTAAYEIIVRGLDFGPVLGLEAQTAATADDVTNMHVHNAPRGVNGPVVFGQITPPHDSDDLCIVLNDDASWTVSGVWETTDPATASITSFADALNAANAGSDAPLYFNVHTTVFPAGEIRGQWVARETEEDGGTGGLGADAVDWEALAARVLAFHTTTGSWGLLSEWLSDMPPDAAGDEHREVPADLEKIAVQENGASGGDWHL